MKTLKRLGRVGWNVLISIDQLGNVLLGLFSEDYGEPDETISSVLGRKAARDTLNPIEAGLVKALDWIDESHVKEAIEERFRTERGAKRTVMGAPRRRG